MATRIRLARHGRKKKPVYDIVVADTRSKRDGRFIEKLGTFNPNRDPGAILLNEERALHWLMVGAQPSDTTRKLLSRAGVMLRKHLQVGVNKGAITQEVADERYAKWLEERKAALGQVPFTSKLDMANTNVAPEAPAAPAVVEAPAVEEEAPVAEEAAAPVAEEAPAVEEAPAAEEASEENKEA